MVRHTQPSPAGVVATWTEGEAIVAKLQISNMLNVQIAQAQGVKPTGYLVIDEAKAGNIGLNTYLRFPKAEAYVCVADNGVVEAGAGIFKERQYAVEAVEALPK